MRSSRKKVLLLDDDAGIIDVVEIILAEYGCEVVTTEKKVQIEQTVTQLSPDLILLDIWIAGCDGQDIFRKLRQNPKTAHIPIIMISAKNDGAQIAQQLGAQAFIPKPFDIDDLTKTVLSYLN